MSSTSSSPSEGEQVRAAAYALGPLNPGGVGHVVEGLAIFYGIIAAIVLSIRVWVRSGFSSASPTRLWGVDDYLAFVGTVSSDRFPRDYGITAARGLFTNVLETQVQFSLQ